MGELIHLATRRADRHARAGRTPPAFFFDVVCPLSYLAAEHVERMLGEVEWVAGRREPRSRDRAADARPRAARARRERAPARCACRSSGPTRFPAGAPCAQRAAAFACELGAGPAFALAASRLAFCGGFDLDDPETLAEAAAAAGVPLGGCLEAAGETLARRRAGRDRRAAARARDLRAAGGQRRRALVRRRSGLARGRTRSPSEPQRTGAEPRRR